MAQPIEITAHMRNNLKEFGPESKVFQPWSKIHQDFKGIIDGKRMTMQLSTRGTILTPWHGPKILEALNAEQATN